MFLTTDDGNSSSKEVSNSSIENKEINVGEIRSMCSADELHAKFIQAASEITCKEELIKTSIKDEKVSLLKGLIVELTVDSSSKDTDIDNQPVKLADNATANSQGTTLHPPLSLTTKWHDTG
eukprot:2447130-Ditylum_brightwellii.AAC.1